MWFYLAKRNIFHQPRFPWNKGSHFPLSATFCGENSCEVAMYFFLGGKCLTNLWLAITLHDSRPAVSSGSSKSEPSSEPEAASAWGKEAAWIHAVITLVLMWYVGLMWCVFFLGGGRLLPSLQVTNSHFATENRPKRPQKRESSTFQPSIFRCQLLLVLGGLKVDMSIPGASQGIGIFTKPLSTWIWPFFTFHVC